MTECRAGDSAPGDGGVEADAAQRGAAPSDGPATVSAAPAPLAEASDERDSDDAQVDTDEPQVCAAAWSAPAPSDSTSRPPSARTNRRFTVTRLEEGGLESPPPLPRPPPLFLPSRQDFSTQVPTPAATIPTPVLAPIPGSPSAHFHTPAPAAVSAAPADPDGWDYGPDTESAAAPAPAPAPAAAAGTAAAQAAVTSAGSSGVPAVSSSGLAVPAAPACRCSPSAGRSAPVAKTVTVAPPLAKPVAQRVFAVAPAAVPAGVPVAAGSRVPPAGPTRYYATIQPGLGGLPASAFYQPTQRQPLLVTGHSATLAAGLAGSARLQQALQSRLAAGTDSVHPRLQPSHPLYRRLAGVGEYNPAHTISYGHSDGRQLTVRRLLDWEPPDLHTVRKYTSDAESESDAGSVLSVVPTHRGARGRTTWTNKVEFILACLGYAVGLGNLWRFPYLCYKSGGGAFFIPYLIMMVVCSIPILLMELTIGQFTRQGPVGAMGRLCPLLKGAGVAPVVISFIFCTYYNVVIGWALYYLFSSFSSELPWTFCNNTWNTPSCEGYISRGEGGISLPSNYTSSPVGGNRSAVLGDDAMNQTDAIAAALATTPEEEYFSRRVLAISSGVSDLGTVRIPLMLTLLLAWVLVYFSIWKSIRSSGKVVYVTVIAPYLLLTAFLWRALTLEGASTGIRYLFQPHWSLLADSKVWVNALAQNFNSVGIGFGSMITFASYNKFENRTILLDTTVIILANLLTSVFAGIIVFATLGNIAMELDRPIQKVVVDGPGLVYVVYPKALASMPFPQLWSVLFFFMLLCLGLDSQFATLEVVITSLQDGYSGLVKRYLKRHELLVLVICLLSFGLGLPYVTQGGMYVFQLMDYNVTNTSLILLALFEVGTVAWVYGTDRLSQDFLAMTGRQISGYFLICLKFLAPLLILAIWVFSLIDHEPLTYGPYDYPEWAYHLGWLLVALPVLPIPICAGLALWRAPGNTLLERLKASVQPDRRVRRDLGYEPTVDGPDLADHPGLYYEMSPMSAHAQIPYSAVNGDADSK